MTSNPALLRITGVGRRYAGVTALAGISLDVRGGEVLAIVGENGAGKSTLLKILSGVVQPSEGSLEVAGPDGALRPVKLAGVRDAARAGIALVHQELNLPENLDVAGSIFLGREPARLGFMDLHAMRERARGWLRHVGLELDPSTPCGTLPIAQRQLVEIAKALTLDCRILILDEPTAALGVRESGQVLNLIRQLRERGLSVVLISHNMPHVWEVSDRIQIQRLGGCAGVITPESHSPSQGVAIMTGAEMLTS